jgi:hypothetical protein
MNRDDTPHPLPTKRVLGDEWIDWDGRPIEPDTSASARTFILLSLIVCAMFVLIVLLFWYLVLPRFELFGRAWAFVLTIILGLAAVILIFWYMLLASAVLRRKRYFNICLTGGGRLLFLLLPFAMRIAGALGISKDRLRHSFIRASNTLAAPVGGNRPVLVLFPRCLRSDIRSEAKRICAGFPGVVLHTVPGGTEARKIINDTSPGAIVAVACERDLLNGIQDVAPRIPVIGIPNSRPSGPCADTVIDTDELQRALAFFNGSG